MKRYISSLLIACACCVPLSAQQDAFKPSGSVWGLLFGDYFYKSGGEAQSWGKSQYANVPKNFHAFQLRRLYLGYDYKMAPDFTGHVLFEANDKSILATTSYAPFIKQAYLEWKNPIDIGAPITVNIGLVPTPIFTLPERTWGYRSVEKEILDSRGISASADFGLLIQGAFDKTEDFGYQLMIGNGTGTKAPDFANFPSREKEFYGSLYARLLDRKITLEGFVDYRNGEQDKNGNPLSRFLWRGFACFQIPELTVGVEYGNITESNYGKVQTNPVTDTVVITKATDLKDAFLSAFATTPLSFISDKLSLFARYDMFNNDANFNNLNVYSDESRNYTESLMIIGLTYKPISTVSLIPNVEINSYKDRRSSPKTPRERSSDVVPRITFFYVMR